MQNTFYLSTQPTENYTISLTDYFDGVNLQYSSSNPNFQIENHFKVYEYLELKNYLIVDTDILSQS